MIDFIKEPAFEIGRRIEMRGRDSWFVVIKPVEESTEALDDFAAELTAMLGEPVRLIRGSSYAEISAELTKSTTDAVLIPDLNHGTQEVWRAIDINRSGMQREGPIILWCSITGVTNLINFAPNIRSFVGGSIFNYKGSEGEALTAEECRQRIADLESYFQMTSQDVIRLAESSTLPVEPHFVEWLVLLDRGDLI